MSRLSRKIQRQKGSQVKQALATVQQSVGMLSASGVDKIPTLVEELKVQVDAAAHLATDLSDAYQMLERRLQVQQEVTLRLIKRALDPRDSRDNPDLSWYRQLEAEIRAEVEK